jgi:hypothetical protein
MADWGVGSSLRRVCAPAGALFALGLIFAVSVSAAPSPDPPPLPPAPPKEQPVQPTVTVVVRQPAPVVTPAPVVQRPAPVAKAPVQRAKPKPAPVKVKPIVKPKAAAPAPVVRVPHDRNRVPLAAFVAAPSSDSIDRDLLALAGFGLLLVALGGAVVLFAARRQLALAALGLLALIGPGANAAAPPVSYSLVGTAGANGWHLSNVTLTWTIDTQDLLSTSGCDAVTITSEGQTPKTCNWTYTWGSGHSDVVIRIDKTAPSVSGAALARAPDSNDWFNRPVAAAFSGQDGVSGIAGCSSPTYSGGDSASASLSGSCKDVAGNASAPATVGFKYDATAPAVTAAADRAPDVGGWYNHPLTVSFAGTDATSGIASCARPSYGSGDGASVSVSGACTDVAGNSTGASFGFKYDATPPAVTAAPDRKPDAKGWYRKPLTVNFAGADATSGIAACTAPSRYAGPDLAKAAVVGSCRDGAGNAAEAAQAFRYDATAPKLPMARAEVGKGFAKIVWKRSPDAVLVELERSPGVNGRKKSVVYQGNGASFTDRTVRDGVRYRYEIKASDVAGNVVEKAVTANVDLPALYRPSTGATVHAPLVLAWEAVKGATFYNVQLYRNKVKVLTFWPEKPTFRIGKSWRFAGKVQRLGPGKYDWYVWGARGTRATPQYGKLLGSNSFVVK